MCGVCVFGHVHKLLHVPASFAHAHTHTCTFTQTDLARADTVEVLAFALALALALALGRSRADEVEVLALALVMGPPGRSVVEAAVGLIKDAVVSVCVRARARACAAWCVSV